MANIALHFRKGKHLHITYNTIPEKENILAHKRTSSYYTTLKKILRSLKYSLSLSLMS